MHCFMEQWGWVLNKTSLGPQEYSWVHKSKTTLCSLFRSIPIELELIQGGFSSHKQLNGSFVA